MSSMPALYDTDVLIDLLRGKREAREAMDVDRPNIFVSVITVAELYQGVRDGNERATLAALLADLIVLDVNEDIAREGGLHRRAYKQSHGSGLSDCLIAATAQHYSLTLKTLNTRHFPMLSGVVAPYQKQQ